jgi:glucuronoarabinoxylan endo-1,4-beta-xylanase
LHNKLSATPTVSVSPVAVDWSGVQQPIDGFGGAAALFAGPLTNQLADFLFTTSGTGIGLSIVRVEIIPSMADCAAQCSCACVTSSGATLKLGELQTAQQAVARGAIVMASQWSPDGAYKSNGKFTSGGSLIGNSGNYAAIANELAGYPALLAANGVSLYALSPQNEPDVKLGYPSCIWTAQQFHDFVPYLYSALQSAGYGNVQIMIPEYSSWNFTIASTAMNDSSDAADVGILAGHAYGRSSNPTAPANYGKHLWQTEGSSQSSAYDGSMTDALGWAAKIHSYLATANVNAWIWWFLSDMPGHGEGTDNAALTDFNGNIPKRAYITGNWSKFVRRGWHRVGVSNSGPLLVTAFESADNSQSAVVVVNRGSAVSNQLFGVATQMGASATPWITSSTQSLARQTPVPVSGGWLTYTIPANSVVTFVGADHRWR